MSKPLEQVILRNAFQLIQDKRRWTRFSYARDSNGDDCEPTDVDAKAWCALGALKKCAFDLICDERKAEAYARRAINVEDVDWTHLWWINDVRGHTPTIRFFQKVVERRLRFGERRFVMHQAMDEHHTPLREARERERVRRLFAT